MVKNTKKMSKYMGIFMESLKATTTKIKNIRAYLLTSLFNAVATMGTYYTSQANHDLHPDFCAI
ncbi:MAG: DUF6017 domain-containing protein [Clostridiales bacterium]